MENLRPARPLVEGERVLGKFIIPPFQRKLVWNQKQKEELIESIYMGLPIGSIVFNQTTLDNPCDHWLLDGQQRVTTILNWMNGKLKVRGYLYPELPKIEQDHFKRMTVSLIETNIPEQSQCKLIYNKLIYGGTPHEAFLPHETFL
jgi:hypothetical protein